MTTSPLSSPALLLSYASPSAPAGKTQAPATPPPSSDDRFSWSEALALPSNSFLGASAGLSTLTSYADRFPAGGVTINPSGIHLNPEWTRDFGPGSAAHDLQPVLAGVAWAVSFARGCVEIGEVARTGDRAMLVAGTLDLALSCSCALQFASPGLGAAATIGLGAARLMVDLYESAR